MDSIDYKELYEATFKYAKQLYSAGSYDNETLEAIFPELKESESEKVKKAIFGMVYDSDNELWSSYDVSKSDVLAWLEKQDEQKVPDVAVVHKELNEHLKPQGEQKPADEIGNYDHGKVLDSLMSAEIKIPEESLGIDSETYNKIVDECIYGEQKPADTYCQEHCKGYKETGKCFADGECKVKREAEQKPAWSKEDEEISEAIIKRISGESDALSVSLSSAISWVENVKDRVQPQPKQEWSEEDIELLNNTIKFIEDSIAATSPSLRTYSPTLTGKEIPFLKALKDRVQPQNHWKPSDEQMKCLDNVKGSDDHNGYVLNTLYNDLKKLREEQL